MYALFADRKQAGKQLAKALLRYRNENPVVLAIPRGGVPIGLEVACALDAPLDIVLVRKIGAPFEPELAIAAGSLSSLPSRRKLGLSVCPMACRRMLISSTGVFSSSSE